MRRQHFLVLLSAAALSACTGLGNRDDHRGAAGAGATSSSKQDSQIMRDISQANLAEIATGKLAVAKASSPQVRQFGQQMIEEHSRMQSEGSQLTAGRGMRTPAAPDLRHQAAMEKLESLSGEAFDRAYMEQMVKDHGETLQLLQQAASRAQDPELRAHARKATPHVQHHLELAQRIAGEVVGLAR
ncbi:MAG TPA: DUF4142 domain-containing protein [Burkholderiales bacterium]|nr:DUF4142 domain-containing protein [Burkholderiales bacterium]